MIKENTVISITAEFEGVSWQAEKQKAISKTGGGCPPLRTVESEWTGWIAEQENLWQEVRLELVIGLC